MREGAHPLAIKERLGHASIQTTLDTYGGLFPSLDEAALEPSPVSKAANAVCESAGSERFAALMGTDVRRHFHRLRGRDQSITSARRSI